MLENIATVHVNTENEGLWPLLRFNITTINRGAIDGENKKRGVQFVHNYNTGKGVYEQRRERVKKKWNGKQGEATHRREQPTPLREKKKKKEMRILSALLYELTD